MVKVLILWSGGVDSTLVMALLRKALPDIQIEAISVKFADSVDETKIASIKIANNPRRMTAPHNSQFRAFELLLIFKRLRQPFDRQSKNSQKKQVSYSRCANNCAVALISCSHTMSGKQLRSVFGRVGICPETKLCPKTK